VKKMKEFDYEADLEIDRNALDLEWIEQPRLFMKYAEESAKADNRVMEFAERLKVLRSELILEANEQGEDVLGEGVKATAVNCEAYYRNHKKYRQAKQEWIEASGEAGLLKAAVFAMGQRKTALENLARLHGQEYFAGPRTPRDLDIESARWKKDRDAMDKIKERRMTRRKKKGAKR
jgi:hypothetical protein